MRPRPQVAANDAAFSSRQEAEAFLARALPLATRANPKYLTKSDGLETVWLTNSLQFAPSPSGGVHVAMDETYTRLGAVGAHQAAFSLADVEVTKFTEAGDVTPSGEPALGLLFTCVAPQCVSGAWVGQASKADKADIYIQDPATREKILAAFLYLKGADKAPT